MPDENLPDVAPAQETAPEVQALREPSLPATHFRNIIDPDSPISPSDQVDAYRKAHPRLFRR